MKRLESNDGRRGNYTMMMGAMTVLVLGFAAFSIDMSLIALAEIETQAAANSAAHAALVAFRENRSMSEAQSAATAMLDENPIIGVPGEFESGYPKLGTWSYENELFTQRSGGQENLINSAQANVVRSGGNAVELILAPVAFGRDSHETDGFATTSMRRREIMLVQDMSCSMMDFYASEPINGQLVGTDPGAIPAEERAMYLARQASHTFLNYLVDHPNPGDRIGLTLFSSDTTNDAWVPLTEINGVNLGGIQDGVDGICSSETTGAMWYCTGSGTGYDPSTDTTYGCSSNHWYYSQQHYQGGSMGAYADTCHDTGAPKAQPTAFGWGTNPAPAMEQAVDEILSSNDDTAYRALVINSDGLPNNQGQRDAAVAQADRAAANDIEVWTVVFHNGNFDPDFMTGLKRGPNAKSYVAPSANELDEIMLEIARSISLVMVE